MTCSPSRRNTARTPTAVSALPPQGEPPQETAAEPRPASLPDQPVMPPDTNEQPPPPESPLQLVHWFWECHCWLCRCLCQLQCCVECCIAKTVLCLPFKLLEFALVWIRYSWVDIVTILTTTGTAGILYLNNTPVARSFAVTTENNSVVYPQFAYPLRREIVPSWLAILLGPVVPVVCILALQLRIRSFWDANNAIFGVLYALSNSVIVQVILKWLVGGLRPHFLDVCKPDLSLAKNTTARYNAAGFQSMYYTREVCTGDAWQVNDSLTSFPSGHTTAAFAGFVFLSLYMNAKFKIFSSRHSQHWKLLLFTTPLLFATLIGGALTIDAYHNWYDIVAGAIIGTFMAFCSYRMTYAAIFDWRHNHIPLNRVEHFAYDSVQLSGDRGKHFGLTHLDNSRLHLF